MNNKQTSAYGAVGGTVGLRKIGEPADVADTPRGSPPLSQHSARVARCAPPSEHCATWRG
jgi:hypothetical protein